MKPRRIRAFRLHSEEGVEADWDLDPVVAPQNVSFDVAMKLSAGGWALSMPQNSMLGAERQPNSCSSEVCGACSQRGCPIRDSRHPLADQSTSV